MSDFHLATFAGGCFWCLEPPFAKLPGVLGLTVGYTGGTTQNPTYEEVCGGESGHVEAMQVQFDPALVSYAALLDIFWRSIDPTDDKGQFADRGNQYRPAILCHDAAQKAEATASRDALEATNILPGPVRVSIEDAGPFYPAEEYHQNFYCKRPLRYQSYRTGSGRPARLALLWGQKKQ